MDRRFFIVIIALVTIVACAVAGGGGSGVDLALVRAMVAQRLAHPWVDVLSHLVTRLGSATFLLPLVGLVAGWLWWKRRVPNALFLIGTALGGRIAIELIKLTIARPRPEIVPYPVSVSSFSFPSGHAGNSMTTFLAIAIAVAPPRYRARAIGAAVAVSLAVGTTRPLLGVHWPSDVLAGWAFGIAWVALCLRLVSRRGETAA